MIYHPPHMSFYKLMRVLHHGLFRLEGLTRNVYPVILQLYAEGLFRYGIPSK
jgi:hypothetical protein